MSTELALHTEVDDLARIGKMLAMSGYFETTGKLETAIAQMATKVMAGREMGFGPFASVTGIYIIKGRPSVGANLMAAAVKANPRYDYRVRKMSDDVVELEFFELASGKRESLGISSFTKADAQAAGTQNMGKFPRNMLFARAMSNGVRWYCPDVFSGTAVYVPDELGAIVDESTGEIIDVTPEPSQPTATKATTDTPPAQNGAVVHAETAEELFGDPPITEHQMKRLHAVGQDLYGKDDWDAKRAELVHAATKQRSNSAKDLTQPEASRLIAGMVARLAQQQDAKPQIGS